MRNLWLKKKQENFTVDTVRFEIFYKNYIKSKTLREKFSKKILNTVDYSRWTLREDNNTYDYTLIKNKINMNNLKHCSDIDTIIFFPMSPLSEMIMMTNSTMNAISVFF